MLMPWSRFGWLKVGAVVSPRVRREAVETAEAEKAPGVGREEGDPLFEGGGQVLLSPSFWEKASWGIAVLAALGASGTASAGESGPGCPDGAPTLGASGPGFPRTSQTPRISLHVSGR